MEQDAKRMLLEYNRETKRLDDLYRCAAKQCGISECAFWILYTLRAEERQFTQAEICEFLIEPKQTVHSALKKLEAEGYLARTSGADLRSKRVALTEKGEQFARAWIDRVLEAEAAALCAMPEAEIRYNKLRKLKKAKKRHGLQNSGRMKLRHAILKGDSKPCPKKLYS